MVVKHDGSVWRSGAQSTSLSNSFVQVIESGAVAAAAGDGHSLVLKQGGYVWATGQNSKGQLGDGTVVSKDEFFFVKRIARAMAVAVGGYHSMLLTDQGHVWSTGWNRYGQLGDGSTDDRKRLYRVVSSESKVLDFSAGDLHSMVLRKDRSVWATGRNHDGQLGDGTRDDKRSFVKVMNSGGAQLAAGGYHSLVRKQDGSVYATGWNEYGQLGAGSTIDKINYVQVISYLSKAVAAGSRHSMVLKQDRSVWASGYNLYGQLGDGSTTNKLVFVKVISDGAQAVADDAERRTGEQHQPDGLDVPRVGGLVERGPATARAAVDESRMPLSRTSSHQRHSLERSHSPSRKNNT